MHLLMHLTKLLCVLILGLELLLSFMKEHELYHRKYFISSGAICHVNNVYSFIVCICPPQCLARLPVDNNLKIHKFMYLQSTIKAT